MPIVRITLACLWVGATSLAMFGGVVVIMNAPPPPPPNWQQAVAVGHRFVARIGQIDV